MRATSVGAACWTSARRWRCLRRRCSNRFSVLPPGEQFLGYPVAGPGNDLRPGRRSWNIVWYRPADEATELPRLLTDETGHRHEMSIPPPLVARSVVADMREAGAQMLPPQMFAALERINQPFFQPIYDLESASIALGRVALMGDAAFVVRPHVGAGIVKAVGDAAALPCALATVADIPEALRIYESARLGVGRAFVAQARKLGVLPQVPLRHARAAKRDMAAYYADPVRVLAETAVLDFLREPGHTQGGSRAEPRTCSNRTVSRRFCACHVSHRR